MAAHGVLNVYKPAVCTSFAVVARLKRILGVKQIGHGGTLDPLATGVLPVFLNQATRMAEYMLEHPKTYIAEVELGVETTTYDREGEVVARRDFTLVEKPMVEAALVPFVGEIQQVPPVFSAIKQAGKPLYLAARDGQQITIAPRAVRIYRVQLLDFALPHIRLEIECGRGTYIRSLAHDLGEALGCGATLTGLERSVYGPFSSREAVTVDELEKAATAGTWTDKLFPLDCVVNHWPEVRLEAEEVERVMNGQKLRRETIAAGERLRACLQNGQLVALLFFDPVEGLWCPRKVFKIQPES